MYQHVNNNRSVFMKMILLLIVAGAAVVLISPVSADTGATIAEKGVVTITAIGDQSYYMGEKVVFSGANSDSDWWWKTVFTASDSGQWRSRYIHLSGNKTGYNVGIYLVYVEW
jgi:basic membrane lipoprotein Med (substrate-binding protein (PBP1-ABC) superfamily)